MLARRYARAVIVMLSAISFLIAPIAAAMPRCCQGGNKLSQCACCKAPVAKRASCCQKLAQQSSSRRTAPVTSSCCCKAKVPQPLVQRNSVQSESRYKELISLVGADPVIASCRHSQAQGRLLLQNSGSIASASLQAQLCRWLI